MTIDDLPHLDREEIEELRETMPEAMYNQEFECDFTASDECTLISIVDVIEANKRDSKT